MQSYSLVWTRGKGWAAPENGELANADLILAFGNGIELTGTSALRDLQCANANAVIASVSTAGEIVAQSVLDDSVVALCMKFERTTVKGVLVGIESDETVDRLAERLVGQITVEGLAHVFVFSDGLNVNGSALSKGLSARLPGHVAVTGGLAGDGDRFKETYVGLGCSAAARQVVAIALYGDALQVGFGSVGGWDAFGPERLVTQSVGNVLFTLDGEPALALYKRYLGEAAEGLPASALLFPLALTRNDGMPPLVRTILAVNEEDGTMTFAGDVPQGSRVRLMHANFDRLVDGAENAAKAARTRIGVEASAAILVSCVGRRLVLRQRVEDEIDGVRAILGPMPVIAGFYSYGEITPLSPGGACELHNQTMTITTLAERL